MGLLQEVDDLLQFFLRLFHTRDILERDFLLMGRQQARAALAERQGLVAAALHLAHEEDPETDDEQHRQRPGEKGGKPRALIGFFALDLDVLLTQDVEQVRILHRKHGLELITVI